MKYIKTFENKELEKEIEYYDNGNIKCISYQLNGKYHREDGPAYQSWYENGQKFYETYFINGIIHREDGPCYQEWNKDGKKSVERYRINGKLHREDGPAHISYHFNGNETSYYFYLNNVEYKREDWLEELKKINSPHYEEQKERYELEKNIEKYNL